MLRPSTLSNPLSEAATQFAAKNLKSWPEETPRRLKACISALFSPRSGIFAAKARFASLSPMGSHKTMLRQVPIVGSVDSDFPSGLVASVRPATSPKTFGIAVYFFTNEAQL